MAESIGQLVPTKIPSLSETADIQEAFRLYHYGAPSGTSIGNYDPTNTNPANLIQPSIAYTLNFLNEQVTFLSNNLGVQASLWTAKGALVTATAASTPATLAVSVSNGFVLTSDSTTATGLKWSAPEVTLSNTVELTNKTLNLTGNTLTGTLAQFNTALSDNNFASLTGTETLTNKTLTAPSITTPTITTPDITNGTIDMRSGVPDTTFTVTSNGSTTFVIDSVHNPTLNLVKGRTYSFALDTLNDQFWIQTVPAPYSSANVVTSGITNNGATLATLTYEVPTTGVTTLYYVSHLNPAMTGTINIVDAPTNKTTVKVAEATADRTILFPNASGTVITTGNLADIVSLGQITSLYATGKVVGHPDVITTAVTNPFLVINYDGGILVTTASSPVSVTVPQDDIADPRNSLPVGSQITVIQQGTGQVTFVPINANVTVAGTPGLKLRARYSSATALKIGINSWIISGDLVA